MPYKYGMKSFFTFPLNSVIPFPLLCLFIDEQYPGTVNVENVANNNVGQCLFIGQQYGIIDHHDWS